MFDMTPLALPRTGIGNYLRGALAGLAEASAGAHEVVALAVTGPRGFRAVPAALDGIPVERKLVFLPLARVWRELWSRAGRPALERVVGRFDVLHLSDWWYPPQLDGLRVTTIHDLIPLRFPEWVHPTTRRLHAAKYRNAAQTCDLVFVNSEFTAGEVEELLGVPRDRIRVAPPGVDPRYRAEGEQADLGCPYVLTVAADEPRKNLSTLLAARLPDGHQLVVVGIEGTDSNGVRRLGYVSDEELSRLYRGAAVFVYPSRFEGFGMPVVEAMASGVPVVASSHSSLDEASGDAAVRADPDSPEAFSEAIARALAEREELVRRGLEHARAFTWGRMGRIFLDSLVEARS